MNDGADDSQRAAVARYRERILEIRTAFERRLHHAWAGLAAVRERAEAMDALLRDLWSAECARDGQLAAGMALIGTGGYGRGELFPRSDVDLLFVLADAVAEHAAGGSVERIGRQLWDAGARVSLSTRHLAECRDFNAEDVEFAIGLLDARLVCGEERLGGSLTRAVEAMVERDGSRIAVALAGLVEARYAKYGGTLFHLEPNVKDCPGGLRDAHVCGWLARLLAGRPVDREFTEARGFLATVRCFLHFRRERDDNTLDWQAQDEAAADRLGLGDAEDGGSRRGDASYWMRIYYRHARVVNRRAVQGVREVAPPGGIRPRRLRRSRGGRSPMLRARGATSEALEPRDADAAQEPDVVLALFAEMAAQGFPLAPETEDRLSQALPVLSANLEEGPALWHALRAILTGPFAGQALRAMHALGLLELLIPEFHGIDALVVRDAYHRYTVDEHTFVLIDTLHRLAAEEGAGDEWTGRFRRLMNDLPHPGLLMLAALLHDTGKGRKTGDHAIESERMTRGVLARLELDGYESELVLGLVRHHLEMPAALRRDIFDNETVRAFAAKVPTPEALRMLTLFTYADIHAVHPDALTPWKAENLWRLYMATANYLDRNVDEERVRASAGGEAVHRILAFAPGRRAEVESYLEGFPERYLRTRTAEQIATHFEMSRQFVADPVQLNFRYSAESSEITLVTRDREMLFATMAGVLAAWGMNIVTADAFANARGVVVDSFRFTDSFRTLEMNVEERGAFVASVHAVLSGKQNVEKLLAGRRRGPRRTPKVATTTRIDFDPDASSHSTHVQVVAQDTPGLLHALSVCFVRLGCNVEVALVDTEGETAIDVFYLTKGGQRLDPGERGELREALLETIRSHAMQS